MADSVYYLHGIVLPSGALLGQLTDTSPAINSQLVDAYTSGFPQPLFRAIASQKFQVSFTSYAIGQLLNLIATDTNSRPWAANLSAANVDLLYKRGRDLGLRYGAADPNHVRLRVPRCMLYWDTITGPHQGDATIAANIIPTYDGTNPPIIPAGTVTLSGTPAVDERYTMGPVWLNASTSIESEQSFSVQSGAQREEAGSKGLVWDTYTAIKTLDPQAQITALGPPMAGLAAAGTAITQLDCWLRAKSQDGHNVADGSASHIKIAMPYGIMLAEGVSGGGNNPAQTTLRGSIRAPNGLSNALAFTVGTAIA